MARYSNLEKYQQARALIQSDGVTIEAACKKVGLNRATYGYYHSKKTKKIQGVVPVGEANKLPVEHFTLNVEAPAPAKRRTIFFVGDGEDFIEALRTLRGNV